MPKAKKTERDHIEIARSKLLKAILPHVEFDGWSTVALDMAIADSGVDAGLAAQAAPRGAIDLAAAFHRQGDELMLTAHQSTDISDLRYSQKIARMVQFRIEAVQDKEAVRRGMALFALPSNMGEGGQLIWGTVDHIWNALGDTSTDANWYTKRGTLSAVYSSTILFWLGDDSAGHADTWAFLDRRIENVMQFEKTKAKLKETPIGRGIAGFMDRFNKPNDDHKSDFPGYQN
jgi:ubiquinone biosynthesis protein COQ9